jgi:DNA-binding transcriptional MocR family regulator
VTEDTQQAIADELGVSKGTVQNAKDELGEEGVNLVKIDGFPPTRSATRSANSSRTLPTTPGPGGRFHRLYSVILRIFSGGMFARESRRSPVVRR